MASAEATATPAPSPGANGTDSLPPFSAKGLEIDDPPPFGVVYLFVYISVFAAGLALYFAAAFAKRRRRGPRAANASSSGPILPHLDGDGHSSRGSPATAWPHPGSGTNDVATSGGGGGAARRRGRTRPRLRPMQGRQHQHQHQQQTRDASTLPSLAGLVVRVGLPSSESPPPSEAGGNDNNKDNSSSNKKSKSKSKSKSSSSSSSNSKKNGNVSNSSDTNNNSSSNKSDSQIKDNDITQCMVCLEPLLSHELIAAPATCEHWIHLACMLHWLATPGDKHCMACREPLHVSDEARALIVAQTRHSTTGESYVEYSLAGAPLVTPPPRAHATPT